ncbi:MAG: selenium cofactor biosynthesis protein YqeC [Acidimicrobiales bacterium]|nr:selenium cofactor biosynthesis protein YqeC [Acidimicrobiales bacterium]
MRNTIDIEGLAAALAPGSRSLISLVGGGGKTTALFALGEQLAGRVVLTTTTKMGSDRVDGHHPILAPTDVELATVLDRDRVALVWGGVDGHRALGVTPEACDRWSSTLGLADHVVVEADGSRRRPFKAPALHEPVVPAATTLLVACVGAAAFDGVIGDVCHRPEEVAVIAGCSPDDRLTADRLAAVLSSADGSQKGRPPNASFVVVLNQVDTSHDAYVADLHDSLASRGPDEDVPVLEVATAPGR